MKKIWARIGVSMYVTDSEYEKLKARRGDIELSPQQAKTFLELGKIEGDSYIPETVFWWGDECD